MFNVNAELRSIFESANELNIKSEVTGDVDQSENESLFESIKSFAHSATKVKGDFDLEINLAALYDVCKQAVDVEDIEDFLKVLELSHDKDELAEFIVSLCPELIAEEHMINGIQSVLAGSISMNGKMRTKFYAELGLLLERFYVLEPSKYEELIKNAPQGV